jgi:hypothetical protein
MKNRLVGLCLAIALTQTPSASAWSYTENFNEGAVDQSIQGSVPLTQASGGTTFSTDYGLMETTSAKMSIAEGETGFGTWGAAWNFPEPLAEGDELWISFSIYIPSSFVIDTPRNGSLKFIRIRTKNSDGSLGGYNDFQIVDDDTTLNSVYRYINEERADLGWSLIGERSSIESLLPRDRWFNLEIYFRFDEKSEKEGGNANIKVWIDNTRIWDAQEVATLGDSTDHADAFYLFTYWNGGAPKTQSLYIDNLEITTSEPTKRDTQNFPFIGAGKNGMAPKPPIRVEVN